MNYKHKYIIDNGAVKFKIELHQGSRIITKPDNYQDKAYLKALKAGKVESYKTDPLLTDDFKLVEGYDEIMKEQRNEAIRAQRAAKYRELIDPVILEKLSEADDELKAIKDKIRKELPYVQR